MAFDISELTNRELVEIEKAAGVPSILDAMASGSPSMAVMVAIVWGVSRRDDPSLTFDAVMDWPVSKTGEVFSSVVDEPTDPTDAPA